MYEASNAQSFVKKFEYKDELTLRREKMLGNENGRTIVFKKLPGESARVNWLKGIPVPLMPEPALQADPRINEKYGDRVEVAAEQAREQARKVANSTTIAKVHEKGGDEALKKMYMDQANDNPYVAAMGGAEKLKNMTEAERAAAARNMVSQTTGGYTPEQIKKMTPAQRQQLALQMASQPTGNDAQDVSQAFTKELMVNEDLRKRYAAMSNAEKQAYYKEYEKRYFGREDVNIDYHSQSAGADARTQDARDIFAIEKFAADFRADLENSLAPIRLRMKQNEALYEQRMKALSSWVTTETEKLPIVSDSEYGPRRVGAENVEVTAYMMNYYIGRDRIRRDREIWEAKVNAIIPAIIKLDNFVASYDNRKDLSDRFKLALAEAIAGGYDAVKDLNKEAGYITSSAAGIEYQFQCMMLHNCDDPRANWYNAP